MRRPLWRNATLFVAALMVMALAGPAMPQERFSIEEGVDVEATLVVDADKTTLTERTFEKDNMVREIVTIVRADGELESLIERNLDPTTGQWVTEDLTELARQGLAQMEREETGQ